MHTCTAVAAIDYTGRVVAGGYRLSLSRSQEMGSHLHRHSSYRVILTRSSVDRHRGMTLQDLCLKLQAVRHTDDPIGPMPETISR